MNGGLGSSTARQWGPAASGMRRVPENRAAEAYEVLMSWAGGSRAGSINSEDAAAVSAYVRDSLACSSDRAQHGTESQASGDSRMSSMGPHDGSAVVRPGDAHAALRRALSLVKKQGSVVVPEEAQEGNRAFTAFTKGLALETARAACVAKAGVRAIIRHRDGEWPWRLPVRCSHVSLHPESIQQTYLIALQSRPIAASRTWQHR